MRGVVWGGALYTPTPTAARELAVVTRVQDADNYSRTLTEFRLVFRETFSRKARNARDSR